jgi:predicted amidohydrolase
LVERLEYQAMSKDIRITIAQCVSLVGKVEENLRLAESLCEQASQEGTDLILFPETHASGYSYRDLYPLVMSTAETMSGGIVRRLRSMSANYDLVVSCGMFERDQDRLFNTQVVAFPDGRVDFQRKGASACAEADVIDLDPVRKVFEWKDTRFGILICADSSIADYREQFGELDIDLLLHPCAGRILHVGLAGQNDLRQESSDSFEAGCLLAKTMGVTCAVANPIGFSGEDYYPGNSWIVRPDGGHVRSVVSALPDDAGPSLISISLQERLCANRP